MRAAGLPIEVLIDYVAMFQQGDSTIAERKALLIEQRKKLVEKLEAMQETINHLDYKIKRYDNIVIQKENDLRNISD
jgi:DNA-binding transcriptional MerR regulator